MPSPSTVRRVALVGCGVLAIAGAYRQLGAAGPRPVVPPTQQVADTPSLDATVSRYCLGCHNTERQIAGFVLEGLDTRNLSTDAALWEKVALKLRTQEMPPVGRSRPDHATYGAVVTEIETALERAALANPNPGRVPVHRLNRAEYAAAVRDLLGLQVDAKALLASDEADVEGFDNVASVLSMSPALIEDYLGAARRVSRLAVGDVTIAPGFQTFKIPKALVQDEQMSDDLPFGSQGGAVVRHNFPVDADYTIKVLLRRQEYDYIVGIGEPHELDIRIDGVRVARISVGGEGKGRTAPEGYIGNTQGDPAWEEYMQRADANLEVRVPVKAGVHTVGVSFVRRHWEAEGIWQPIIIGFGRATNELYHGRPAVEVLMIGGPYGKIAPGDSAVRRRIFTCRPNRAAAEEPCARQILGTLATRAYRRPVTEPDLQALMEFFRIGRSESGSFDAGIQRGLERLLAAPSFLFRIEQPPPGVRPGAPYRLGDLELASRLSFFLWGSIPDDELRNLAVAGKLKDRTVVVQQVQRMLRDERSAALVDNFATRWLELGKLAGAVPDTDLYREFDENLRESMDKETKLFIADQIRNDRSLVELVSANYSFLNQRLATHYGVPNIYGDHFRKVTFADDRRGGLLGQGSVLTLTSYGNRTSVVLRGRWVLANLLGAPPPAAPPDVPALNEPGANGAPRALRERMEAHRKNAVCAACHRRMDPLGFALENFDATGKWRTVSDDVAVDASASLPDGTTFNGLAGLRSVLTGHSEDFARTVTGKMLAYAIGRGLEAHDYPAVRIVTRDAAAKNYRWSAIIEGIVMSTPFSMSVAPMDSPERELSSRVDTGRR